MKSIQKWSQKSIAAILCSLLALAAGLAVPTKSAHAVVGQTGEVNFYIGFYCGNLMSEPAIAQEIVVTLDEAVELAVEGRYKSWFTTEEGLPCYNLVERHGFAIAACEFWYAVAPFVQSRPVSHCRYTYQRVYSRF